MPDVRLVISKCLNTKFYIAFCLQLLFFSKYILKKYLIFMHLDIIQFNSPLQISS